MRVLLLVGLLSLSASAQPLAFAPHQSFDLAPADPTVRVDPALFASSASLATLAAAGASGATVLYLLMTSCACGDDGGRQGRLLVLSGAASGWVASTLAMVVLGQPADIRAMVLPGTHEIWTPLGRTDWQRGLIGGLVGTAIGAGTILLVGPGESGLGWAALPLAQGIGTGLAVSLRR